MSAVMSIDYNPAAIAAATESRHPGCAGIPTPSLKGFQIVEIGGKPIRPKRATKKAGRNESATHENTASLPHTSGGAIRGTQPISPSPLAGVPIVDGQHLTANQNQGAIDNPIPDAAKSRTQPTIYAPHQEPHLTVDSLPRYEPTPAITAAIDTIVTLHRERQATIKAKTKIILQAKALLRSRICTEADFEDDDTKADLTVFGTQRRKLTKAAVKRVDEAMKVAQKEPASEHGLMIAPYLGGIELFEARQKLLERQMVKVAKQLPAFEFAKSVKGFGDVSFATIVGECGDIGTYKSIAAVWKRLGLAVINGNRQGAPGAGASSEDWERHAYNKQRRSVAWNARQNVIDGMGKWRPEFGEDVRANPELTEYQCVYAERARHEAEKLGLPVTMSDKGKESYKKHVANRAHRYVEKRLIKHLYLAWRRGGSL